MQATTMIIILLAGYFMAMLGGMIFLMYRIIWCIPVTILRYVGNKGRPTLIQSRAKKVIKDGIPRLYVRGYQDPVRDYLAENYYPTIRGKYGGLILWEFEDGLLAPALPKKDVKNLTDEEQVVYDKAREYFQSKSVSFNFDEQLYKDLKLKVVDDVDQEFMLQEQYRLESQYQGGWKDFLLKYGGHISIIVIAALLFAGVMVWFDKLPEFAASCASSAASVASQSFIEQAANSVAPLG